MIDRNTAANSETFSLGCSLFEQGAYAQSHLIFKKFLNTDCPEAHYNAALCLYRAKELQEALPLLEKALILLKKYPPANSCSELVNSPLFTAEAQNSPYLFPLAENCGQILPEYTKHCIIRLLADIYAELGNTEQAQTFASSIKQFGYANISKILS